MQALTEDDAVLATYREHEHLQTIDAAVEYLAAPAASGGS
jgi:TPP-dependent pyruvate/acetoin dehydrogenase alpha subunit